MKTLARRAAGHGSRRMLDSGLYSGVCVWLLGLVAACTSTPGPMDAATSEGGADDAEESPRDASILADAPARPDAPIPDVVTLDEYAALWPVVMCDALVRCGREVDPFLLVLSGAASCEDSVRNAFENLGNPRLVEEGRLAFDGTAAAACLSAWASDSCEIGALDAPPCVDVFTGSVADGGACTDARECTPGSYCAEDAPSVDCYMDRTCCADTGRCAPRLPLGSVCTEPSDCRTGAICVSGTCTELTQTGRLGEPCTETAACVSLLTCYEGVCTDPRTLLRGVGQTCDTQRRCASGLACTSEGCVELGAIGESCRGDPFIQDCVLDAYCSLGTCAARLPVGTACSGFQCALGATCSMETRRCVERRRIGASCAADEECASVTCRDGRCAGVTCL